MDERHTNASDISYCYERIKEAYPKGDSKTKGGHKSTFRIVLNSRRLNKYGLRRRFYLIQSQFRFAF